MSDVQSAVLIHANTIKSQGSILGDVYLTAIYQRIIRHPVRGCGMVACTASGGIVGSILCTTDINWFTGLSLYMAYPKLLLVVLLHLMRGSFSIASLLDHKKVQTAAEKTYCHPYLSIQAISADTKHQGKGIGRQLVDTISAYGRTHGVRTIYVDTLKENIGAQKFYLSVGFQPLADVADSVMYEKKI